MRRPWAALLLLAGVPGLPPAWAAPATAADAAAPATVAPATAAPDPGDPLAQLTEAARLYQLGRYEDAVPFAQRALALAEAALPAEDPRIADSLTTLGAIQRAAGHLDAAQPLFERALAIRERVLGPEDAQTAVALNNLASLALARGDAARAAPLLERALAIREKQLGPEAAGVATGLTNLAAAYDQLGRLRDALPLHQRSLAIREKVFGPDDPQTATTLNNLAETQGALGRYREALRLHQRALAIRDRTLGPDHPETLVSAGNVAALLESLGRLDEALALQRRVLAATERQLGPDHPSTAVSLDNLASVCAALGHYDEAAPLLERALAINTRAFGAQSAAVATTVGRLANLALQQGQFAAALPLAQRAVAIREALLGRGHPDTAIALNNLAEVHASMGEYGEALTLHQRALALRESALGPDHPETASGLNNLAELHKALGQYPLAEPLLRRALTIREKTVGPDSPDTALSLNNLAQLYVAEGHPERALPLARRALAIAEQALGPDHPDTATALGNLAGILEDLKQPRAALPLQQRSLALREAAFGPRHANVAISLNNLAALYETLGKPDRALPLYNRAYAILQSGSNRVALAAVASRLGKYYNVHREPDLAIFYLKQAINVTQQLRGGAAQLDLAAQRSLTQSVEPRYRLLAALLVQRGRLAEAEEVLTLLKLEERRELVRGDARDATPGTPATLTAAERALAERLAANATSLSGKYAELEALDQGGARDADTERRRQQLGEQIQSDGEALDALLRESVAALAQAPAQGALAAAVADRDAISNQLATLDERSGAHAAAVYFVPAEHSTTFLVVTARGAVGVNGGVGEAELNRLAGAMRQAIQNRSGDYRGAASQLYAALIKPVAPTLEAAHVDTLMLYLVGSLRYVPVAALYDGAAHRHLIEQYALAVYTAANLRESLAEPPIAHWVAAGVGVSREYGEFPALTAVPAELTSIVQASGDAADSGVLPGERFLDAAFTRDELHALARRRAPYSVLHVATHFKLVPGREDDSELLLGDGDLLSMQQLRSDPLLVLGTYDLVTLSACNTSMGSDARAGTEFEGLATTLLRKGARAVIASLWEVQDTGTARLMRAFYAARGADRQRSKAEALRQAQLALLGGQVRDATGKLDFRHPYYWAAFILMGNWL